MRTLSLLLGLTLFLVCACESKTAEKKPEDKPKAEATQEEAKVEEPAKTEAAEGGEGHGAGHHEAAAGEASDALAPGETKHFGADFTIADEAMPLTDAMAKLDEVLGKPVKVQATVKTSCRKKGCWMQLEPATEGGEPVRVTFKDYGFFVPKHADGASAVVEGTFVKETMSEADRKHHAEDGGQSPEQIAAITGDEEIVKMVATAVDLTGGAAAQE